MDLIIDAFGTFIGCTGERIVLRLPSKGKKRLMKEYPIRRLKKIVILRPSSISTHAVKLALEHDVDIVYLGAFGKPVGRIFSSDPKGLATARRAQLETSTNTRQAMTLSTAFISGKCKNQITFLKFLSAKYSADFEKEITQAEAVHRTLALTAPDSRTREQLLGIEGFIADMYWKCIGKLHKFPGRVPQGRDKFNSIINYGYGILYNKIERACLYVGLDPWLGLYHSERYGKPALVLDLIEEFRVPVVDSALLPILIEKKIGRRNDFEKEEKNEYRLSPEGKAKVVEAVLNNLNKTILWKGKRQTIKAIIEEQNRSLSRYFLGKEIVYTPLDFARCIS